MNTNDAQDELSPAQMLGDSIRLARTKRGITIAQLAEKIGRPREWLNRVELGYSEFGDIKPPSESDLRTIISILGEHLDITGDELVSLGSEAESSFQSFRQNSRSRSRKSGGKQIQAEVIIGEAQIGQSIVDLIGEQHSDAVIRNTGIRSFGSY
ncbi:MAG: helix-turn-helix transcriptional regulator, partial [Candidatus Saccharibacteria bacterium]